MGKLKVMFLLFFLLPTGNVYASEDTQCAIKSEVDLSFFNGVNNTEYEARESLKKTYDIVYKNNNKVKLNRVLYYNKTIWVGVDAVEVFDQRLTEQLPSLKGRMELFSQIESGGAQRKILIASSKNYYLFNNDFLKDYSAYVAKNLNKISSNNTQSLYSDHRKQLDSSIKANRKILMIAHSQGNLFVNKAYAHAAKKLDKYSLGVVHVAPASTILNGKWVLADGDIVINGLRILGSGVPDNTDHIQNYMTHDPAGHSYVDIYMNSEFTTSDRVMSYASEILKLFEGRDCDPSTLKTVTSSKPLTSFMQMCDKYSCLPNSRNVLEGYMAEFSPNLLIYLETIESQCKLQGGRVINGDWEQASSNMRISCKGYWSPIFEVNIPFSVKSTEKPKPKSKRNGNGKRA